jgi:hypothetical protein
MTKKTKQHKKYAQRAGQLSGKQSIVANKVYAKLQVGLAVQKVQSSDTKQPRKNATNTLSRPFGKPRKVMLG